MKKIKITLYLLLLVLGVSNLSGQQWGNYTLIAKKNSTTAILIDTNNATYHTWSGLSGQTAYSNYMLPGGTLLRTVIPAVANSVFTGGGIHGRVQKVDYSGTLLWDYTYSTSTHCAHHDICGLPNGNVLLIAYELKSNSQVTAAGCTYNGSMWPDHIVEVQPTGATTGTIVWEWHLWDHLCQDDNANGGNYVTNVNDHPELYDVNYAPQREIWHTNGIDYNPILDQIVISAHFANEFFVIDHSTSTAESASHAGGRGGRGGDFLYRWGNPSAYGETGTFFNVLHDAHWVPQDCPNAGNIAVFHNKGISNTISSVDQFTPPYAGFNYTYTPNTAWAPTTYANRITCIGGTSNEGNAQQLPNGNTLYCLALSGNIVEVNSAGTTLWTYTATGAVSHAYRYSGCQVANAAPAIPTISQLGNVLSSSSATTYQWYVDGVLIPGATAQSYTASGDGVYVVRVTDSNGCWYSYSLLYDFTFTTGINVFDLNHNLLIYPNPANQFINISGDFTDADFFVEIVDVSGRIVYSSKNEKQISVAEFKAGLYIVIIRTENEDVITKRISITK
ncbi:hypothetical protein BH09BAC5_BH09BAC5_16340 [soil metagenome]